jgi:Flp pilus assembly protein TadB
VVTVIGLLAALLAGSAVFVLLTRPDAVTRERLAGLTATHQMPDSSDAAADGRSRPLPALAAGSAGLGVFLFLGGITGAGAGLLVAVLLSRWLAGLEPRAARRRREQIEADLPVAADLLAACLLAGCPPSEAAVAVSDALEGPLAEELRSVVATLRLGGDPAASWLQLTRQPALAPLGRCWARALQTGAPLAETMTRLADEQRSVRRWVAEAEAKRAGVRAAAPLGLCFLPAFVLIGVVPAVAGIASSVIA